MSEFLGHARFKVYRLWSPRALSWHSEVLRYKKSCKKGKTRPVNDIHNIGMQSIITGCELSHIQNAANCLFSS